MKTETKTLEQIIIGIMELSKKAMKTSPLWEDVLRRCERCLRLMGEIKLDLFEATLNVNLKELKDAHLESHVPMFQTLLEELNERIAKDAKDKENAQKETLK